MSRQSFDIARPRGSTWIVGRLMHHFTYRVLVPLGILAWCLASSAQDSTGQPILIEGAWTYSGPKTVIGSGTDTSVVVRRDTNGWSITFEHILFPSVNQKDARPVTRREGPYIATVDDKELVFTKDGKEVRHTFLCDSNRMILPAILQKSQESGFFALTGNPSGSSRARPVQNPGRQGRNTGRPGRQGILFLRGSTSLAPLAPCAIPAFPGEER